VVGYCKKSFLVLAMCSIFGDDYLSFFSVLHKNTQHMNTTQFSTIPGGENPGPGRPENNWAQCLADDLRVFRATEGSTYSPPLVFGVETVLWPTAAKKGGKWYRGVVQAADCFMARWHRDEAEWSWLRHA
ncbi:unnamed protein product, partial [Laminaria digitata]